jgi:FixJ family two-component response regulator
MTGLHDGDLKAVAIWLSRRSFLNNHIQPKTISVVDDDERVLQSMESLLLSVGYEVRPHLSGEAFLSSGDLHAVDCLISDVGMPGMSGIELLDQVRHGRANLPVILITGRREESLSELALRNGACHFFEKPLDIAELIAAIQTVLDGSA